MSIWLTEQREEKKQNGIWKRLQHANINIEIYKQTAVRTLIWKTSKHLDLYSSVSSSLDWTWSRGKMMKDTSTNTSKAQPDSGLCAKLTWHQLCTQHRHQIDWSIPLSIHRNSQELIKHKVSEASFHTRTWPVCQATWSHSRMYCVLNLRQSWLVWWMWCCPCLHLAHMS